MRGRPRAESCGKDNVFLQSACPWQRFCREEFLYERALSIALADSESDHPVQQTGAYRVVLNQSVFYRG
ncbi:hypothetical protein CA13_72060 [Planctomycetes bacterium CA13]|uniref:Uncharacterized protein n=1 Tax=Novipirellula herctigrandis TaxID=2527986 RepID=A0A5C5YPK7_9BACT|nr:hypothetical protein CA13_72060 [Planctomycetes bacterium CA13]